MDARVEAIARGEARELVWLLEHPPLYTAGTSSQPQELIEARFPVHAAGRGGQFTYHGPGQRVGYVMLDLKRRAPDVRRFVATIEEWIIRTLAAFNVRGERRDDRIGVWVRRPDKGDGFEDKIAAIGIRVQRWVTLHGFALNIEPELSHFSGIVPCGVSDPRYGVTSLADLGLTASMPEVDMACAPRSRRCSAQPSTTQTVPSTENSSPRRRSASSSPCRLADRRDRRASPGGPCGNPRSCGDDVLRTDEQGFDGAVAAIADPALQAAFEGRQFGPGAIADALHATADDYMTQHVQVNSPSLRGPAPGVDPAAIAPKR